MKLSLLNAGHSVLGILGALVGYNTIDEVVNDKEMASFLIAFMNKEATPSLGTLKGIDLKSYKKSLIERFGNQNIKDQVSRICSESSAKIPIFILPTVHAQLKQKGSIEYAAFVIAAWAIYSLGVNENGDSLTIKDVMKTVLHDKALASKANPQAFLEIESVFGTLKNSEAFVEAYSKSYKNILELDVEKCIIDINS